MENFVPKKQHLREVLLHYFISKKSAYETHKLLVEVYGEYAPSKATCENWFRRFKNEDSDVSDKEHGKPPKKFEDAELEALLDEDPCQTEEELAETLNVDQSTVSRRLHKMGMVQKQGNWVPYELTGRQQENRKSKNHL